MLIGILNTIVVLCSVVLILLVLIQRGKGGGLAGAFGGMGGSSAFGTKAGDVFTKVTMYIAGTWIAISMLLVILVNRGHTSAWGETNAPSPTRKTAPKSPGKSTTPAPTGKDLNKQGELDADGLVPPPVPRSSAPTQPANPGDPLAPLPPETPGKTP